MEIKKVIRILSIFIAVAAFAIFVAAQLMFDTPIALQLPILVALIISVVIIWSDTAPGQEQEGKAKAGQP